MILGERGSSGIGAGFMIGDISSGGPDDSALWEFLVVRGLGPMLERGLRDVQYAR